MPRPWKRFIGFHSGISVENVHTIMYLSTITMIHQYHYVWKLTASVLFNYITNQRLGACAEISTIDWDYSGMLKIFLTGKGVQFATKTPIFSFPWKQPSEYFLHTNLILSSVVFNIMDKCQIHCIIGSERSRGHGVLLLPPSLHTEPASYRWLLSISMD